MTIPKETAPSQLGTTRQGRSTLWLVVREPKGGAAYPMRATANNHALAFMEPSLCNGCSHQDS